MLREQKFLLKFSGEFLVCCGAFIVAEANSLSMVLGGVLMLIATVLRLFTWRTRYELDSSLSGPFRFVKLPMELSWFLLFLGIGVAARSFLIVICVLLLSLWHVTSMRLRGKSGKDYQQKVPYFPSLWPVPPIGARLEAKKMRGFFQEPWEVWRIVLTGVTYLGLVLQHHFQRISHLFLVLGVGIGVAGLLGAWSIYRNQKNAFHNYS